MEKTTTEEKISIVRRGIVSARVLVDNSGDTGRRFHIEGEAMVSGTGCERVDNGRVGALDAEGKITGAEIASFSSYGANGLNLGISDAPGTDPAEITTAISAFITKVKESFTEDSL